MCYHNPKTMARRIFILLTFLVLTTTALQAQTRRFVGAWFSIRYPYTFKAKGECPSESMPSKYDAATFTSPDGACTFYVFAPKGDTDEADKIMRTSKGTPTSKGVRDDEEVTFSSFYDAKLKRTCSYRMVRSKLEKTVYILGIRFKTYNDFEKYKKQYEQFKKSHELYAI